MARRRRKRYPLLMTFPGGTTRRVDVLAYSHERAIELARSKYSTASSIKDAVPTEVKVNWPLLREAAKTIGLTIPVAVRFRSVKAHGGQYVGVVNGKHVVEVSTYAGRSIDFINRTLWHELAHALQCERDWNGKHLEFFRHYNRDIKERAVAQGVANNVSYKNSQYELEANSVAERYAYIMLVGPA